MKPFFILSFTALLFTAVACQDIQREEEYDQEDLTGGTNTTTSPTSGQK